MMLATTGGLTASEKGKQKAKPPKKSPEVDSESNSHTSGPLPKAAADAAVAAYREYLAKLEGLSTQYGKPVNLFQQVVGETLKRPCQMNVWNAFQAWHGEFGDIKHNPNSMSFLTLWDDVYSSTP